MVDSKAGNVVCLSQGPIYTVRNATRVTSTVKNQFGATHIVLSKHDAYWLRGQSQYVQAMLVRFG